MNIYWRISQYILIPEWVTTAEKWGIKQRRIRVLCAEGRISGDYKVGTYWLIPSDAKKPKDERIKSGKYIKSK